MVFMKLILWIVDFPEFDGTEIDLSLPKGYNCSAWDHVSNIEREEFPPENAIISGSDFKLYNLHATVAIPDK